MCLVVANYKYIRPKLQTSDIGVTDGVADKLAGKVEKVISKTVVTNAGRLTTSAKNVLKAAGKNVTRAATATVKAQTKKVAASAGKITKNTVQTMSKIAAKKTETE